MAQRRTRMTDEQALRLLECFVAGMPARPAADLAGVNRNTARVCYHHLREAIALHMGTAEPWQDSTSAGGTTYDTGRDDTNAPPDRSLLGPLTQGDMRMVPLAGLVEHFGHVQVVALPDPAQATAGDPLAALPALDAAICADQIASDTDTTNLRQGRLRVVLRDDVARDALRARTLRNFWRRSAGLLRRYNGIPRQHLFLFLKECEWRFSDGSHEANLATLRAWFTPLH